MMDLSAAICSWCNERVLPNVSGNPISINMHSFLVVFQHFLVSTVSIFLCSLFD